MHPRKMPALATAAPAPRRRRAILAIPPTPCYPEAPSICSLNPAHDPPASIPTPTRSRGRPRKGARKDGGVDGRCTRGQPSEALRQTDIAGLRLLFQLQLTELAPGLVAQAEARLRAQTHYAVKLTPYKGLPPAARPHGDLLRWAMEHRATADAHRSCARCFYVSKDIVQPSPDGTVVFEEWTNLERWLQVATESNVRLTFDTKAGFGLVAVETFRYRPRRNGATRSDVVVAGVLDYASPAERGYAAVYRGGVAGTTRGPVRLANHGCGACANTVFHHHRGTNTFTLRVKSSARVISPGQPILATYEQPGQQLACYVCGRAPRTAAMGASSSLGAAST